MASLAESLPPPVRIWFAFAVAGIITADGVVTEAELDFLREVINFLDTVDDINQVVKWSKPKNGLFCRKSIPTLKQPP